MNALVSPYTDIPIPQRDLEAEMILECVCKAYQMSRDMLSSERKHGRLPEARAVAVWLLRTRTHLNLQLIGELLNRDHSSLKRAMRLAMLRRTKDEDLDNFMEKLAEAVDARLKR